MPDLPLQITFRDVAPSDAVRARIEKRVEKLRQFHPRLEACRVVVSAPHHHHRHGRLYSVRIDVKAPQRSIVINREPSARQSHADVYVAIRDAFDALDRRIEDTARRRRGDVKAHAAKSQIRLTATRVKAPRRRRTSE